MARYNWKPLAIEFMNKLMKTGIKHVPHDSKYTRIADDLADLHMVKMVDYRKTVRGGTAVYQITNDGREEFEGLKEQPVVENQINELKFNVMGKLFLASLGAWFVGHATRTKLRGSPEEIRAVANALMSSRKFQDELNRPGATIDSVMAKLNIKNMSAREFERIFSVPWPL